MRRCTGLLLLFVLPTACVDDRVEADKPEPADALISQPDFNTGDVLDGPRPAFDAFPDDVVRDAATSPDVGLDAAVNLVDALTPDTSPPDAATSCPARTRPVERCVFDDPLCWVVEGQACLSSICPVPQVCPVGDPVDVCPGGVDCTEVVRCGLAYLCPPPDACLLCEIECAPDRRTVARCAPNGLECTRAARCCQEIYCERCPDDDEDCLREPNGTCPSHTSLTLGDCDPTDPLCWTLPDGTRCMADICSQHISRVFDCDDGEVHVESCDGFADCREVANCGRRTSCARLSDAECCEVEPTCPGPTRPVDACAPNGSGCLVEKRCCGGRLYCSL